VARLLIVDDEVATGRSLSRVLRAAGHLVSVAASCAEGRAASGVFECAVLDIDLGDGSGIDLAHELLARGSVLRVVFYSGSMDDEVLARVADAGALVVKSEPISRLLAEVERLLEEPVPRSREFERGDDGRNPDEFETPRAIPSKRNP
jgi:DNA-binding response OmpR family regulator